MNRKKPAYMEKLFNDLDTDLKTICGDFYVTQKRLKAWCYRFNMAIDLLADGIGTVKKIGKEEKNENRTQT